MGCDIRRPVNALVTFGFERIPGEGDGSTAYACALGGGATAVAWGFGIGIRLAGDAFFVRRHPFSVEVDTAAALAPGGRTRPLGMPVVDLAHHAAAREALGLLCDLFVTYEQWVRRDLPAGWRHDTLMARPRRVRRRLTITHAPLEVLWQQWRDRLGAGAGEARPDA